MKQILNKLEIFAKGKGILISAFAFIGSAFLLNGNIIGRLAMKKQSSGIGVLKIGTGYNTETIYKQLSLMGEGGRQFYLTKIIPLEIIFAITFGVFFSLMVIYLIEKLMPSNKPALGLAYIPLLSMCFGIIESINILIVLLKYPEQLELILQLGNLLAMIKSSLSGFTIMVILISLLVLLLKNGAGKVGLR